MTVPPLPSFVAHPAAFPGDQGLFDPRSWLVAISLLALVIGTGWWLRRPVRRGPRRVGVPHRRQFVPEEETSRRC